MISIRRFVFAALAGGASLVFLMAGARAQTASPWAETENAAVRLISAADAVGSSEKIKLGLHFRMKDGWKVYWRSAGDAGYAPRLDWSASKNIKAVKISWPAPGRFEIFGYNTLGYKDEVVLPLDLDLNRGATATAARVSVDYLICKEICIPIVADLALDLPAGPASPSAESHLIGRYGALVPGSGEALGLKLEQATVFGPRSSDSFDAVLRVKISSVDPMNKPDIFVEGPAGLVFSAPSVGIEPGGRKAAFDVLVSGLNFTENTLAGSALTLTFVDKPLAAEFKAVPAKGDVALPSNVARILNKEDKKSLWTVIGLALLAGLILNLMPSVLPVLSIKLLDAAGRGGRDSAPVRHGFFASALGILASFLFLALILAGLKAGGVNVGWGVQFQTTWFLITIMILVTLFMCNLWGFLKIQTPGWIMNISQNLFPKWSAFTGDFLAGALAVVLATPFSAPFLGVAVGFALGRGPVEILVIFLALGIGLATPYLALAAVPGVIVNRPKPGRAGTVLKFVFGVALAGMVVWLQSILTVVSGREAATLVGGIMVALATVLYFLTWAEPNPKLTVWSTVVLVGMAFLSPRITIDDPLQAARGRDAVVLEDIWRPFDEKAIPTLVAEGKTVLIDVTAQWCITCGANRRFVLSDPSIVEWLKEKNIVAMQADWTSPDKRISNFLARFEHYEVPFNVAYGPGAPKGTVLPEILTKNGVLEILAEVAKR